MAFHRPPPWAGPVLRALLPHDRADDVQGDLLETFRDDLRLTSDPIRAQVWHARQVTGIFIRAYWSFPALLVITMMSNDVLNAFRDSSGGRHGPDLFGYVLTWALLAAGLYGGWRTRRLAGGVITAAGSHLVAWCCMTVWWTITTYPFALYQQNNPYWIQAWHWSASPGETFMHWIIWDNVGAVLLGGSMLLVFSLVLGLIGGLTGSLVRTRFRPVHT